MSPAFSLRGACRQTRRRHAGQFAAVALAGLLLLPAWHLKHPLLFAARHIETPALLGIPCLAGLLRRYLSWPVRVLFLVVFLITLERELEFQATRAVVLSAGPAARAVGAHVIAGYTDIDEARELAAKGLIGGVYLTGRNVRGRRFAEVAAELADLQATRRTAGLPPLIVAADQEGGRVSHLSPLLEALPPLSTLRDKPDPKAAARRYGHRQGEGLAALGVTLNLGPVVDLSPADEKRVDGFSQIAARAIAADPQQVVAIGGAYLEGLGTAGVQGTLKHFPGLGRLVTDTHFRPARLDGSAAELSADWQPFRQLSRRSETAIMLGHVTLAALDPVHAVSHSRAVIDGVLRQSWGFDGVLITDDLNMGAVYELGIGTVAAEALAAGADLVLVSYDPRQVYRVIAGAASALTENRIAAETLMRSKQRLATLSGREVQVRRQAAPPSPSSGVEFSAISSLPCSLNCMACRRA